MTNPFEQQHNSLLETWRELVDDSLGKHEGSVREILQKAMTRDTALRMLGDYVWENVSESGARDDAEKLGTDMPDFVDNNEEVLWNLFVNLRSDK